MYNATDRTIKTVVGSGGVVNLGDGGPATSANAGFPRGVALDSLGNVYFADSLYHRICMVNATTNVITTVSGSGEIGWKAGESLATATNHNHPFGVAIDAFDNLLIADAWNHVIR